MYSIEVLHKASVTYTSLWSHQSLTLDPGESLIFHLIFIALLLTDKERDEIFIDLCALVCFNFLRTLRSSGSCIGHPRGLQFPHSFPTNMSDFLYHSPSHTVSPTHSWRFLSCGAQTVASAPSQSVLLCISTPSRASSKTTPERDMLWLWENEKIDKSHNCVRES